MIGPYGQRTAHSQRPKGLGPPSRTILSDLKPPLGPSSYEFHHLPVMTWAKDFERCDVCPNTEASHILFLPGWKNKAHAVNH